MQSGRGPITAPLEFGIDQLKEGVEKWQLLIPIRRGNRPNQKAYIREKIKTGDPVA